MPDQFINELIKGIRRECTDARADSLGAALPTQWAAPPEDLDETARYYALCERAWLHWTRVALDHVTWHALQHVTRGPYNPRQIRNPDHATQAARTCGAHSRLLAIMPEALENPRWPWQLEAARHIHASTQAALKLAANIDTHQPPNANELNPGIKWATDALVTALSAGFIHNATAEATATLAALTHAGER